MKIMGLGVAELGIIFMFFLIPLVIGIVCCVISVKQAEQKGYSKLAFGLLGFFFGFIGLIIALVVPNKNQPQLTAADALTQYKQLLDQGAITQEEFEEQKQKLLHQQ